MGGVQYEHENSEYLAGRKDDLINFDVPSFSTSTGTIQSISDELAHRSFVGVFFCFFFFFFFFFFFEASER